MSVHTTWNGRHLNSTSTWSDVLLVDTAENENACSELPAKGIGCEKKPYPRFPSMRCCWTPRFRIIIAPFRLVLRRLEMGRMKNTGKDKEQTVVHLKP